MPARRAADTMPANRPRARANRAALRSQNALAAFPESARAYPAAGHAPGQRSTRDRATNICWRLLVRTMPGQNCIDPRALEDRPRRFRVGILRAPKTWTLKKLGVALISRVAVLLEFVLAVTAASMPIVTLGINGQGRTYLTGRAPSRRSFARGGRRCRSNRPALCRSCCASQARSGLAAAGGPHRSSCHAAKRGPSEFLTTARAQIARAASLAG
jgi:hypothetical protein